MWAKAAFGRATLSSLLLCLLLDYQLDGKNVPALEPLPYQSSIELLVCTHPFLMELNVLRSNTGAFGV